MFFRRSYLVVDGFTYSLGLPNNLYSGLLWCTYLFLICFVLIRYLNVYPRKSKGVLIRNLTTLLFPGWISRPLVLRKSRVFLWMMSRSLSDPEMTRKSSANLTILQAIALTLKLLSLGVRDVAFTEILHPSISLYPRIALLVVVTYSLFASSINFSNPFRVKFISSGLIIPP